MNVIEYQNNRKQILKAIDQLRQLRDQSLNKDVEFKNQLPLDVQRRMVDNLDRESNRLRNPDLTIAFVGGFSAGKSSLVNAFLGRYLLPESTKVTTAVPTFVRSTADENEQERAELHYLKEEDLDALDTLFRKEIAEAYNSPGMVNMPIRELIEQAKSFSNDGRGKRLVEYLEIFHEERQNRSSLSAGDIKTVSLAEATDVIRDEKEAMFLDKVVLKIKNDKLPHDVILVDLPGISVPNPRHRQITYRFVQNDAHAVVFVLMATRLFDKDEMEIAEIFRKGDEDVSRKTFWVMNRWDALSPQQQRQTREDFAAKMREMGINKPRQFQTNALHGLLSQLAITNDLGVNPDLQRHVGDYSDIVKNQFEGEHQKVFIESGVSGLQNDIFDFLSSDIRAATLKTARDVAEKDFCAPVLFYLSERRKFSEGRKATELVEEQTKEISERLDKDCEDKKEDIIKRLKQVRIDAVEKRGDFLPKDDLEERLKTALADLDDNETDAYKIYLDILSEKKYRRFPYYFEIESQIIDKLNTLVKKHFIDAMQKLADSLLESCSEAVDAFLSSIQEEVQYNPEVMEGIRNCLAEKEQKLRNGIEFAVVTDAGKLDGLLVYKKVKKLWFFTGQSEIFTELEEVAKLGCEGIADQNKKLSREHFTQRTTRIRVVLRKHYIESVRQSHKMMNENIQTPLISVIQDVEAAMIKKITTDYRSSRESVLKNDIARKYQLKREENEIQAKKYRVYAEQIEKIQKELGTSGLS
jgi:Dynamin family.